ncbi:MAG TPA: hypothetical protein VEZ16_01045 [Microvirga sp.]|nr:hypothetical protein [Microvirga sp.]
MIDSESVIQESAGSAGSDPAWRNTRDRVREMIRVEVDRANPTDDARYPLELIVESFVRYSPADGEPDIRVVDDSGQTRTMARDGQQIPLTIRDLVEELRQTRPMLFKPAAPSPAPTGAMKAEPRKRDWLDIGADASADGAEQPRKPAPVQPAERAGLVHLRRGRARLHLWTRKAHRQWIEPAMAAGTARLQAIRSDFPRSLDRVRGSFEDPPKPSGGRGLALGALVLAALLGVGGYLFFGGDRPSETASAGTVNEETAGRQAAAEEPSSTGTLASPPPGETPSSPAGASGRSLKGIPDVLDTATLSLEGEVVRLFGVEWAPGAGKPDDLTQYLRGREVTCEPTGGRDTYRCRVGNQDLSKVVLYNGGGKATAEATPDLKTAEERARTAKIGVWNE